MIRKVELPCDLASNSGLEVMPSADPARALLHVVSRKTRTGIRLTAETARLLIDALEPIAAPKAVDPEKTLAERLREAASSLLSFTWGNTGEGYTFWKSAYNSLSARADALETPQPTAADFETKTPPGYATIAHYLFVNHGAERALSEEASAAGKKLVAKLREAGEPLVQVTAPKAITEATKGVVVRVFAYPLEVLDEFFSRPTDKTPFSYGNPPKVGQRVALTKAQGHAYPIGTLATVVRPSGGGWTLDVGQEPPMWVYPSSIRPA
jgi:hypothetical protein